MLLFSVIYFCVANFKKQAKMRTIENFKQFKLKELSLILGGSGGAPTPVSTNTNYPPLPINVNMGLGAEFNVHSVTTNPLGSAAMLVGGEMSFGATGSGLISHESSNVSQQSHSSIRNGAQ